MVLFLNEFEVACIQLTLLLFNACIRAALPFLTPSLFWEEGSNFHNSKSAKVLAFLLSFIDVAVPFIATLFQSDLCIHQYTIGKPGKISIDYTYEQCTAFNADGTCYTRINIPSHLDFEPPAVYSGQCRNAVLQNYLPLVIYACAFQAFANPVIYFLLSYY